MARHRRGMKARDKAAIAVPAPNTNATPAEPAAAAAEENLETDVVPAIIEHQVADREESPETDAAPSAIDRDAAAAPPSLNPETCTEPEKQRVPADDLH